MWRFRFCAKLFAKMMVFLVRLHMIQDIWLAGGMHSSGHPHVSLILYIIFNKIYTRGVLSPATGLSSLPPPSIDATLGTKGTLKGLCSILPCQQIRRATHHVSLNAITSHPDVTLIHLWQLCGPGPQYNQNESSFFLWPWTGINRVEMECSLHFGMDRFDWFLPREKCYN